MKRIASMFILLLWLAAPAWATTISYTSSHLGGTQWRYDYTLSNGGLTAPIDEFSVFFAPGLYAKLQDASTTPAWDVLIIQPDPAIPGDGYLDALTLAGGVAPGAAAGGFSVIFDYFGAGAPAAQAFTVWDPVSFAEIDTGTTTPLALLPLTSTSWLLLAGLLPLAWRRRRRALAVLLAALLAGTLAACGSGADTNSAPRTARLLASSTTTGGAAAAAVDLEVVSLEKIGEQRVNRSTYDYTYRVNIRNNSADTASNVTATLSAAPASASIIGGTVTAAAIAAGATVAADGQIVLRIDRSVPFDPAGLAWHLTQATGTRMEDARPAEVYIVPLADLGLADGADSVGVTGAISEALLKDGTLRFVTPGDTGENQFAQFHITRAGVTSNFNLLIRSELPTAIVTYIEPLDDGTLPATPPKLLVTGLGPNNLLRPAALSFKLEGSPALDLKDDSGGLVTGPGDAWASLKPYWTYTPADGSFTLSASALSSALGGLPNGPLHFSLNFVSKDGGFAAVYELTAIKAGAQISGKLVNSQGAPVTTLAGRKVLLKGYNSHLRAQATVDASGNFSFSDVIPDTYQITLSDLENPNVVSVSGLVFNSSSTVNVTLVLPSAAGAQKSLAQPSVINGGFIQDGAAPAARQAPAGKAAPSASVSALAAGTLFQATAAAQNQTITTPISFNVPKGTQNVGVKITVFTEEYPVYTTAQSQYNDTWSYAVTGLPGAALSAAGAVNQSHYTQGTISKTSCVDVSSQAKDAAFTVGGAVSATNIGDSILPTTTTVELSLACAGLQVTLAKFTSPNQDAHPVLQAINVTGNLTGPYISVSQGSADGTHTVPLEVQYSPSDAEISEVNISIAPNGSSPGFASANLLSQTNTKTPGSIKFPALSLPAFATAMGNGKVAVTVRVKGKVAGTEVSSDPAEGGQVAFNGDTAFIPLSLAGSEAGLAGRRYGTRDAGGDSWATRQTINWLDARAYRFDDISGQHVTQTAAGRSILDHAGHSDGQQIDLRYADGQGGYSDDLGGAGDGAAIQALINAAAAEVAANTAQKPKLAALVAWIAANRALLNAEAAAANARILHVGPGFIKLALVDGKFSPVAKAAIPGVAAWNKPAKVHITAGHLSHWHLSLTAHP